MIGGSIGSEVDSKWRGVDTGEVWSEEACKLSQTGDFVCSLGNELQQ